MALDALAVRCLVNEISPLIQNGRVDKIHQPEKDEIIIHIRTFDGKYKLLVSASSENPRIHFTEQTKQNPKTAPMFCMLLRKHIGSAKILSVEQVGFERIVKITFESYDELGDLTKKHLIIEIMGRHSNIILVNDSMKVLDSAKHVDFTMSSVRQILPGVIYEYPPVQQKTPLTEVCADTKFSFLPTKTCDKALMDNISGISPLTARETVYSVFGRTDVKVSELNLNKESTLKAAVIKLAERIKNNEFAPCMIEANGRLADFSSIRIKQYENTASVTEYESISKLLDDFYALRDMRERMRQKSSGLVKVLNNSIERVTKKLTLLEKTIADAENKEKYKIYGDLVTANIYAINQGDKLAEVNNYYEDGSPLIKISLDVRLTPSQNAQKYYKKYSKCKIAEIEAAKQLKSAYEDLDYLESTLAALDNAENVSDLTAIRSELIREGYINRKAAPQKQTASKPMHFISDDGFDIYVGKNNTQNDYLTLKFANSGDMWFHTKNIHGSHTVIKLGIDKDIPKSTMLYAAELAAYYSKARNSSQVPVDYTQIKNVKKPSGAKPGMVIYDSYNTVYVTPKEPHEKTKA